MANILVVEDDENLNHIICSYLTQNNYHAHGCHDPAEAYKYLASENCDLIISDIMMPKIDGFEFAEEIRRDYPAMPILFITALDDLSSKKKGFGVGVDDYMVKPIEMDEMVLRVGALLRRAQRIDDKKLTVEELTLVPEEMAAYVNGEEVPILPKEFNILYKLLSHPKKIFTRSELVEEYWGILLYLNRVKLGQKMRYSLYLLFKITPQARPNNTRQKRYQTDRNDLKNLKWW